MIGRLIRDIPLIPNWARQLPLIRELPAYKRKPYKRHAALSVGATAEASIVGAGTATTSGQTTTDGSIIFVLVSNSTTTPSAPSDSFGNTFKGIGPNGAASLGASVMTYIQEGGQRGASHTFSASNNDATIMYVEVLGSNLVPFALTMAVLDTSSPYTPRTITPFQGVDVMLVSTCVSDSGSNPATLAESTGFTIRSQQIAGESAGIATRLVSGTSGSYTPSWTSTGSTQAVVQVFGVREGGDTPECLSIGDYVNGTANLTPALPYCRAGDMMVCYYGTKPFGDSPTINQSWTSIGSATDGTTGAGVDTGSMQSRLFAKIATSDSEADPTITNTTNNVSGCVILTFRCPPGYRWEGLPVGAGGGDASAGTGFSCTAASNFGIQARDMLIGFGSIRSDAGTQSGITITATGLTVGTFAEAPSTDLSTIAGGDMAMSGGYVPVTAGNSSAAPVYASTLAASHTGSAFMARLRAVPPYVFTKTPYNTPLRM